MNEYTTHKYVVATKRTGRVFQMYMACDSRQEAMKHFDGLGDGFEQVRIYTRGQWNGDRASWCAHKNLVERTDPIPQSIGMWLVNQADAGYF